MPPALAPLMNHLGPMLTPAASRKRSTYHPPEYLRAWYAGIVDLMLSEPGIKNGEIARRLGKTETWISTVKNTDIFRAYFEKRRTELDTLINERIASGLGNATALALDNLVEGLKSKGAALPVKDQAEIANSLLAKLGYGSPRTPQVQVNVGAAAGAVIVETPVSVEALAEARASLRALEELKLAQRPVADGHSTAAPHDGPTIDLTLESSEA